MRAVSDGTLNTNYWQVRQGTTWGVKDGALVGSPSPKEFQEQMIAKGDKAHAALNQSYGWNRHHRITWPVHRDLNHGNATSKIFKKDDYYPFERILNEGLRCNSC